MKRVMCLALAGLLLTGCGLLPQEAELKTAPSRESMDEDYFAYEEVKQGDVADWIDVTCVYQVAFRKELSFGLDGDKSTSYDWNCYVALGQQVKKGDVLGEIEASVFSDELRQYEEQHNEYERQLTYYRALLDIETERETLAETYGREFDPATKEALTARIATLEQEAYIVDLKYEELDAKRGEYQLIAPGDGIVTSIRENPDNFWWNSGVKAGDVCITVESEEQMFKATTQAPEYFAVGTEYTIACETASYRTQVSSCEETEMAGRWMVTFEMSEGENKIPELLTTGTFRIVTAEANDVLYVPSGAIVTINGENAVYVLSETGELEIRYVEIGLSIRGRVDEDSNRTEIVSGLKLGERVVVN